MEHRTGSETGTTASFGGSYNFAPLPPLHLSFGANINWANAADQKLYFGITPADAAAASAQGNPLLAYTPRAGVNEVVVAAAGVYQISKHWGALSSFALGMAYSL